MQGKSPTLWLSRKAGRFFLTSGMGEIFILGSTILAGLFPVVTNFTTRLMPPILFAGVSIVLSGILSFIFLCIAHFPKPFLKKGSLIPLVGLTLCNITIPLALIFVAASKTSTINLALLLQTELPFTFLICGVFFGEIINRQKIIGAAFTLIGATIILYKGNFQLNPGDLLIVAATVFYPFGNIILKKVLRTMELQTILFIRHFFGGMSLIVLSLLLETYDAPINEYVEKNILLIFVNGVVVFWLSKIFWFEGLKRIDVSKAISIAVAMPGFSLIYAFIFLREIPTIQQTIGFVVILSGLIFLTRKKFTKAQQILVQ